jgi:hypothetical protein
MSSVEETILDIRRCEDVDHFSLALPELSGVAIPNETILNFDSLSETPNLQLWLFNDFAIDCFPELTSNTSYNYEFKSVWNLIYKKYFSRFLLDEDTQIQLNLIYRRFHDLLIHAFNVDVPIVSGSSPVSNPVSVLNLGSDTFRAMFIHFQLMASVRYRNFIQGILKNKINTLYHSVPPKYVYCNSVFYLSELYSEVFNTNFTIDIQALSYNLTQNERHQAFDARADSFLREYEYNGTPVYSHPAYSFIDLNSDKLLEFDVSDPERLQDNDLILFQHPPYGSEEEPLQNFCEKDMYLGRYRSANQHVYYYPSTDFGLSIPVRSLYIQECVLGSFRVKDL